MPVRRRGFRPGIPGSRLAIQVLWRENSGTFDGGESLGAAASAVRDSAGRGASQSFRPGGRVGSLLARLLAAFHHRIRLISRTLSSEITRSGVTDVKILVVHQYYLMPGQVGGSRFNEMARLWTEQGHEVAIIAGTVDYTSGKVPEQYRRCWVRKERDGDVTVYRCHVPGSYGNGYLGRMWAFFAFTLSASTAALRANRADIVIATSPPLVAVIPGWIAARVSPRPAPWIFEIRDLWPESAVTTGVLSEKSLLTRLLYALEKWACRSAAMINVLTPAFREDIVRRGLAEDGKI